MSHDEKLIWLQDGSACSRVGDKYLPIDYGITLQNVDVSMSTLHEFNQIHMRMGREDLILFRDAINQKLEEEKK